MTIKFLSNVLQIMIISKIGYSLIKWILRGKKRRKKSIVGKIMKLFTNKIHYRLNNALKKQREAHYPPTVSENNNVIPFRKTK